MATESLVDLVGALIGQIGPAEEQDDLDGGREQRAEHQRAREDDHHLVPQRPECNAPDDRQLAFGCQTMDVGRGDGSVVDDDASSLQA